MTVTSCDIVARNILAAYERGEISPVRDQLSSVADAYAVQQATVRAWCDQGRRVVGRKIGLTSKAVQTQLGVSEPDFGVIFDDMVVENDGMVATGKVMQPRIEAEIAFVLGADLHGDDITAEDVIAATQHIRPAFEICGSRIKGWDIRLIDTVADNASAGLVVLGSEAAVPSLEDLPLLQVEVRRNGEFAQSGRGEACLGNPAYAVAWLGACLARFGDHLKQGDIVMSGALAAMLPVVSGDRFEANFGALGAVSVSFGR